MMKLGKRARRALEAVAAGAVKHAHPFTWGVEPEWMDVTPKTLQGLVSKHLIRVEANSTQHWRPVQLAAQGMEARRAETSEAQAPSSDDSPTPQRGDAPKLPISHPREGKHE